MPTYIPPTPAELRAILSRLGLTGSAAGALVDVDGRTVRKWTGGEHRMPFAALYTLLSRARGIEPTPADWRDALGPLIDERTGMR